MKKEEVLDLYKGFPLIPLARNGKNPIVEDWKNISIVDARKKIRASKGEINYGLRCGEGSVICLDFDVSKIEKGIDDQDFYDHITKTCDKLDVNYLVQTSRRGGKHILFKYTEGLPGKTIKINYEGKNINMDFLTNGAYVVVYPSSYDGKGEKNEEKRRSNGNGNYTWDNGVENLNEDLKNLDEVPLFLKKILMDVKGKPKKEKNIPSDEKQEEEIPSDEELEEVKEKFIKKLLRKVDNVPNHNQRFVFICAIRDHYEGNGKGLEILNWWYDRLDRKLGGDVDYDKMEKMYAQQAPNPQRKINFYMMFRKMVDLHYIDQEEMSELVKEWNKLYLTEEKREDLWLNDFDWHELDKHISPEGKWTHEKMSFEEAMFSVFRYETGSDNIIIKQFDIEEEIIKRKSKEKKEEGTKRKKDDPIMDHKRIKYKTWYDAKKMSTKYFPKYLHPTGKFDSEGKEIMETRTYFLFRDIELDFDYKIRKLIFYPIGGREDLLIKGNSFRGFQSTDLGTYDEEEIKLFRNHLLLTLGEKGREIFEQNCAYIVQDPRYVGPNRVMLDIGGKQGTGKTIIIQTMMEIIGEDYCYTYRNQKDISAENNSTLENKLFVCVEEAEAQTDTVSVTKYYNDMKPYVTGKKLNIKRLYYDRYPVKNYLRLVSTTNNIWSNRVEDMERRHIIMTSVYPVDREEGETDNEFKASLKNYFNELIKNLDNESFKNNYYTYLLGLELGTIEQNYDDENFKIAKMISKGPIEMYLDSLKEMGNDITQLEKESFRMGLKNFCQDKNEKILTDKIIYVEMLRLNYTVLKKTIKNTDIISGEEDKNRKNCWVLK